MRLHRTLTPSVFILFLLFWPALVHADYQAGVDTYDRGDYETALKEFRSLAEQGHAVAQNNLGEMYRLGRHLMQAVNYRILRAQAFQVWKEVACAKGWCHHSRSASHCVCSSLS